MANIKAFLDKIMGARYGKDVRSSIVSAIDAVNAESNNSVAKVNAAEARIDTVAASASSATTAANTAAANANEAAQAVLDEKYILTARTEMVRSGTARPTAKGNALLEKLTGSSWQRKLMGKNLYNVSTTLKTTVSKGITRTPVYNTNGSLEYILLNGTATEIWSTAYMNRLYKAGTYIGSCCPSGGSINTYYCIFGKKKADGTYVNDYFDTGNGVTFTITDAEAEQGYYVELYINVAKGSTVSNLKFCPMVAPASETDQTYEPYCGATPSPNPEFQQTIHSTGDMGWFDGEWLQGSYVHGVFTNSTIGIHSKSPIKCNSGDVIKATHDRKSNYIWVSYFDDSLNYISGDEVLDADTLESTVPNNATYFRINIQENNGITPSTVGHVCVTINGKYAAIVDEVGKNFLDDSSFEASGRGITYTKCYENDALCGYKVNGTVGDAFSEDLGTFYMNGGVLPEWAIPGVEYVASVNENGITGLRIQVYQNVNSSWQQIVATETSQTFKFSENATGAYIRLQVIKGYTMKNAMAYPMIRRCDLNGNPIGDNTYTPYTHKRTYIPLDEPLRAIGDVKDELVPVDGWYKVLRRIGEVIFNGTEEWEESSFAPSANSAHFTMLKLANMKSDGVLMTSHFSGEQVDNGSAIGGNVNFYPLKSYGISGVDAWKTWLSENNIIVQYELTIPYYEDLDQTPFYNLQSFDEVTHVSIAGLHENVEPTLTMRFPRHEDGALVTTSYCNSKKEAIERKAEMEEIKAAVLALSQL